MKFVFYFVAVRGDLIEALSSRFSASSPRFQRLFIFVGKCSSSSSAALFVWWRRRRICRWRIQIKAFLQCMPTNIKKRKKKLIFFSGSKKNSPTTLFLPKNSGEVRAASPLGQFEWVPPNVSHDLAAKYMTALPVLANRAEDCGFS